MQLSLLTRYSSGLYKRYYNVIWILKFKNIFKVSLEEAIIKNSNFWHPGNVKAQLNVICEFFNTEISLEDVKKSHTYRKRKRTLKVFSISKEDHKKLVQKSQEMFFELKYGVKNPYQLEKVKEKAKLTKLKRYGDENYTNSNKTKQTKLERYGNENYNNIEKIKETCLERYGVENYNKTDECKEKIKQTFLKNYGVEHYSQTEEYKEKFKDTCLKQYGVEHYSQTEEYRERVKQTSLEKYGVEHYSQIEEYRERVKQTSLEKYGVENSKQRCFINLEDLNEEYFRNNLIKEDRFLVEECCLHFNFGPETANKYKKLFNITEPNKSNTCKTQQFIFNLINIENKIFNDHHLGKELDIYIPDYNLAIEYDGLMFHSEGNSEHSMFRNTDKSYHLEKTELCLKNNIQLFHIFEGEDLDLWLSMINSKLGLNNKIFARKCIIKELKSSETVTFLNKNHLQGFCQAKINVGLFYEDELVSVMTFSKPRFNKKYEYELIRFASKRNYTVVGGASKLWKYFVNKYNPKSVITYANRRFSNGEIYKILGFTFLEKTSPNYFYFKPNEFNLYSRVKFQKHKLKNILEVYDESLSEAENMFNNNYRRIYDCGNLKFEYHR